LVGDDFGILVFTVRNRNQIGHTSIFLDGEGDLRGLFEEDSARAMERI